MLLESTDLLLMLLLQSNDLLVLLLSRDSSCDEVEESGDARTHLWAGAAAGEVLNLRRCAGRCHCCYDCCCCVACCCYLLSSLDFVSVIVVAVANTNIRHIAKSS